MKQWAEKDIFDLVPTRNIYIIAGIFFAAGLALLATLGFRFYELGKIKAGLSLAAAPVSATPAPIPVCNFTRWFDGVCVDSEAERFPALTAVMIENHPEARPLAGLSKASIVYEAPVEAMFTRFMAIFPADQEVFKAGPVRSARPYYLDWLSEYGRIMYMHVGGSPEALNLIRKRQVFDWDQYFHGNSFWRSADRFAPHNVYTSDDLWKKAWADNAPAAASRELESWNFTNIKPCLEECVRGVSINFLAPSYLVEWKYDEEKNNYVRYQAGAPHRDQDGTQIVADTIIVQRVDYRVLDTVGRLKIDTIGDGEVLVFRDGFAVKGIWKKNSFAERTQWLVGNGRSLELKSGKIWIEVVPEGKTVAIIPI